MAFLCLSNINDSILHIPIELQSEWHAEWMAEGNEPYNDCDSFFSFIEWCRGKRDSDRLNKYFFLSSSKEFWKGMDARMK